MKKRNLLRLQASIITRAEEYVNKFRFGCLFPGCTEKAIKSHSQQKERQLRSIAVDGYVYTLKPTFEKNLRKTIFDPLEVSRIGITKASTYQGFCSKHDNELFRPIETEEIDPQNVEHTYLLFFRALTYEYCMKRKVVCFWNKRRELLSNESIYIEPNILELGFHYWISVRWPILRDRILLNHQKPDHNSIRSIFSKIESNINVSCCGCYDTRGEALSELQNVKDLSSMSPLYTFNIIPRTDKSYVIITCFAEHSLEVNKHIGPLEHDIQLQNMINKLAFCDCEDTCISPILWDRLSDEEKLSLGLSLRHPEVSGIQSVPNIIKLKKV
jgi:hypothetical protein